MRFDKLNFFKGRQGGFKEVMTSFAVYFLLVVFLAGFVAVVGLDYLFTKSGDELNGRIANLQNRSAVGEAIVTDLTKVESDFYRLATAPDSATRQTVRDDVHNRIGGLHEALLVLSEGGEFVRVTPIGFRDTQSMVRRTRVTAAPEDAEALEKLGLSAQLDELRIWTDRLFEQVEQRETFNEAVEPFGHNQATIEVRDTLKSFPALFNRIKANASQIFYDGHNRLKALEWRLEKQREE